MSALIEPLLIPLLQLAGIAQLGLAIGSLAIPHVLGWQHELAGLSPLIRREYWVYAAYIWCINVSFGVGSVVGAEALLAGSGLSLAVCTFIFVYWGARGLIQVFVFDLRGLPGWQRWGKHALDVLFAALVLVYGAAAAVNVGAWGGA